MECPKCGSQTTETARYCSHCGQSLAPSPEAEQRPTRTIPAWAKKIKPEFVVTFLVFIAIYVFFQFYFKLDLLLSTTTTTGGDTGTHHYMAYFMKNYLIPKGRLTGWSPDWYAGFPIFTFYFPLPYLMMVLLSYPLPYEIAFKLVTMLGIVLTPVAAFLAFRYLKYDFPMPILAALFTIPFLFVERINADIVYSIYGGNIPSNLAGEFSYSLSLALSLIFLALMHRDIDSKARPIQKGLLLAAMALSHLIPLIMVSLAQLHFLFSRRIRSRFLYLAKVYALGFSLTAFWALPFLVKTGYTIKYKWIQLSGIEMLFPTPFYYFVPLAAIGLLYALYRKSERIAYLLWQPVIAILIFYLLPDQTRLWNGRFIPFYYFYALLIGAYGLYELRHVLAFLGHSLGRIPRRFTIVAIPLIAAPLVLWYVSQGLTFIPSWIKWNYEGYERKADWPALQAINAELNALPPGRVMVEYNAGYGKLGTPRVFELIPYFTHQPTMEGLLIESSITSPFHFYMQAEVSKESSKAVQNINYPLMDMPKGLPHMKLFNVRYFLAFSSEAKQALEASGEFVLKKTLGEFAIYETQTAGYVRVPDLQPVLLETKNRQDTALEWYTDPARFQVPLVLADETTAELKEAFPLSADSLEQLPSVPMNHNGLISETIENEEIRFRTRDVGKPHLISMSYFPNWKAEGAEGPFFAAPSLMMVIPTQQDVRIYYAPTWDNWTGTLMSLGAWGIALYYVRLPWRRRPSRGAPDDERAEQTGLAHQEEPDDISGMGAVGSEETSHENPPDGDGKHAHGEQGT